ncbi:hypothetical protein FACS1894130_06000 [Spirochaetia bacterium]|nr:hypothetical protein FACS1894130_06000 [Spirochaetia bacterium]
MKKVWLISLLVLLSNGLVMAQSSVWKATKDGHVLFLAGSVHLLRDEDFPLPKEFDIAFDNSEVLTIETDLEKMADPQILQHLAEQMVLPDNQTLKSVLSKNTYKRLDSKCQEFGFSLSDAAQLKPSMIMNILSMLQIRQSGFVQQGVDEYYLSKAQEEGKRIDFLESIDVQIAALAGMGEGYDDEYVLYSLKSLEATEKSLPALVSGWKSGVPDNAETEINEMMKKWPALYKTLVYDRNISWMPLLESYLAGDTVAFVIAGLLHFYGPDGLLKQLENRGCKIEQVLAEVP